MSGQNPFIVAFRNDIGVVTWTSYANEADFNEQFPSYQEKLTVVEKGITDERAVELVKTTPPQSYTMSAMREATDPVTGTIDFDALRAQLVKVGFAIRDSRS